MANVMANVVLRSYGRKQNHMEHSRNEAKGEARIHRKKTPGTRGTYTSRMVRTRKKTLLRGNA